jgi:hypothetical protein
VKEMAAVVPDDTPAFDASFDLVYSQYRELQVPKRRFTAGTLAWTALFILVSYLLIAAVAGIIAGG